MSITYLIEYFLSIIIIIAIIIIVIIIISIIIIIIIGLRVLNTEGIDHR